MMSCVGQQQCAALNAKEEDGKGAEAFLRDIDALTRQSILGIWPVSQREEGSRCNARVDKRLARKPTTT
jgi:hypothetical protein